MVTFHYHAKESPEKTIAGLIEANDIDQAVKKILARGLTPLDLCPFSQLPADSRRFEFSFPKKISSAELMRTTLQLFDLLDAGLPLLQALRTLAEQSTNQRLKTILEHLRFSIQNGTAFSDALALYPDVFSAFYISMVRCGEISGQLNTVLRRLADLLENTQEFKEKIISSLIYPAFIFSAGIITVGVLFVFVIPRLTLLFDDFQTALPIPTRILIALSNFCVHFWWLIALAAVSAPVFLYQAYKKPQIKKMIHQKILQTPYLKDFVLKAEINRFSRTLAMLLASGVMIVPALNDTKEVLNNEIFKEEIGRIAREVLKGVSLKAALQESGLFFSQSVTIISLGEEAGRLEESLNKLADILDDELERSAKIFTALLEPALILIMGLMVGFIVMAMLVPIFQLNFVVK